MEELEVVVIPMGELPAPPGGGVIGAGSVNPTPAGELPTHEAENVTGELKPPNEVTMIVVDPLNP